MQEGAYNHGTNDLANRGSFLVMRDRLKARGVNVRASLDFSHAPLMGGMMGGQPFGMAPDPPAALEQGCVILVVNDMFLVSLL